MYGDNDSKTFVVFRDEVLEDTSDDWSLEIHWHGGATFNIFSDGKNVDCFTRYGDEQGHRPSFEQAYLAASEFFAETIVELERANA